MKINYFVATDSATLYWDKPDKADKNTVYEIYVDGVKNGETSKTHFTVFGLESEQKYNIDIKTNFENSSVFSKSLALAIQVSRKYFFSCARRSAIFLSGSPAANFSAFSSRARSFFSTPGLCKHFPRSTGGFL